MGDPETQPILMRLKSDLFDVLMHATDGTLDKVELHWDRRVALGVVLAAAGYPANAAQGRRHRRPAGGAPTTPWCSTPAPPRRRSPAGQWRAGAVRHRAGRFGQAGAAAAYEACGHPLRRHAVPRDIGHRAIKR
jgi:phosphoribosylamine--glycine ligase